MKSVKLQYGLRISMISQVLAENVRHRVPNMPAYSRLETWGTALQTSEKEEPLRFKKQCTTYV